jgi:hypothetical protein
MTKLDVAVERQLAQVPPGPTGDQLRRRAHVRRLQRSGALVSLAAAVVLGLVMVGDPFSARESRVMVASPSRGRGGEPIATTKEFPPLATILATSRSLVGTDHATSAEIVATERGRSEKTLSGDLTGHPSQRVFVVQLVGDFGCERCFFSGPPGTHLGRVHVIQMWFDAHGAETDFGYLTQPGDLGRLGTVYRLPL